MGPLSSATTTVGPLAEGWSVGATHLPHRRNLLHAVIVSPKVKASSCKVALPYKSAQLLICLTANGGDFSTNQRHRGAETASPRLIEPGLLGHDSAIWICPKPYRR